MFGEEFFPTPRAVAYQMLAMISEEARYFLEPSAGKGDLADVIRTCRRFGQVEIDCIEQDPDLAALLSKKGFPVVGFEWLAYAGVSYYDAILMNPPFSEGAAHLLKAWEFLHGGEIVCLLNAETIRNPCTAQRRQLVDLVAENGRVVYIGAAFKDAVRRTDVEVAIVYLKKEIADDSNDLWARNTDEKELREGDAGEDNLLALKDQLGNMQHYYDTANGHMLEAIRHVRLAAKFMEANGISADGPAYREVLSLAPRNLNHARAEFARRHRRDAWASVFEKMNFRRWLDTVQTEAFLRDVERSAHAPFTKENIHGTLENVYSQRRELFEKSVANVFDELTKYDKGNTHHTEGWVSNASHKVNKKLVFPWGCKWEKLFGFSRCWGTRSSQVYDDLDRVLCVLAGKDFAACCTVGKALEEAFRDRSARWCESDHFEIKFFQKGTVHLRFKDDKLWSAFNQAASRGKRWLGKSSVEAA